MQTPYLTVTLELSGSDEEKLLRLHALLTRLLGDWKPALEYGNVQLAYQEQPPLEREAQGEAEEDDSAAWPAV